MKYFTLALLVMSVTLAPYSANAMTTEEFLEEVASIEAQISIVEALLMTEATEQTTLTAATSTELSALGTDPESVDTSVASQATNSTAASSAADTGTSTRDADLLTISVAGGTVFTADVPDQSEALKLCEAIAFDTQYMWQPVRCEYRNETVYEDTFVAG